MKCHFKILIAIFIITTSKSFSNAQLNNFQRNFPNFEQAFFDELKKIRYDPIIAPEGSEGPDSTLNVYSTMYLIDVHKIDDSNMEYRASFYFRQFWNDSRLAYEKMEKDIPHQNQIIINNADIIWTPDTFFIQEKEGIKHNLVNPNVFIRIKPHGEVTYSTRLSVTFTCPMEFENFPHDTQKCKFNIESYGRTRDKLQLSWDPRVDKPVQHTKKINVLPFDLIAVEESIKHVELSFGRYSALEITLTFKRNEGFFITRLYAPFIILVALSWLSFWIKSNMVALRVSLIFVILYLMVNISSNLSGHIPPAPYTKASDVWIATCESLVFAAFLEFIFVSILSRSEKQHQKKGFSNLCDPETQTITDSIDQGKNVLSGKICSSINMMASRLSKEDTLSFRVDVLARILFPILFLTFNFVYWIVY